MRAKESMIWRQGKKREKERGVEARKKRKGMIYRSKDSGCAPLAGIAEKI